METCLNLRQTAQRDNKEPQAESGELSQERPGKPRKFSSRRRTALLPSESDFWCVQRMPNYGTCGIPPPSSLPLTGLTASVGRLGRGFALS